MKPYYEAHGITLYLGDCRDVLLTLPSADLVLTDPPYNIGKDYGVFKDDLSPDAYAAFMQEVVTECVQLAPHQAWVAPRYQMRLFLNLLPDAHMVVVRRRASGPHRGGWLDQFETVLTVGRPSQWVPDLWDDIRLMAEGYYFHEETYGHPGYTPSAIMQRCAALLSTNSLIDPFCGTGTSLRVAKNLGRTAIGIELNERYLEIAATRLSQEVFEMEVA